jgi:hypothetical protein
VTLTLDVVIEMLNDIAQLPGCRNSGIELGELVSEVLVSGQFQGEANCAAQANDQDKKKLQVNLTTEAGAGEEALVLREVGEQPIVLH